VNEIRPDRPAKRRRWARWAGIGCLGVIGIIVLGILALVIFKPWVSERELVAPAAGGERITEDGLLGNYYAPDDANAGAVLVIGGSDGGISASADGMARALRDAGFHAMAVSYWGGPGQPGEMRALPLEYFGGALDWLARRPGVDGRVAVMGYSKGAEAALLVGTRRPDLDAVIAGVPSHVSWQSAEPIGIFLDATSTFSADGGEIPYMPYGNFNVFTMTGPYEIHEKSLIDEAEHPEAAIPVERIRARLMLLCGGRDRVWPSCRMSGNIVERMRANSRPAPAFLRYPQAGHGVLGPPPGEGRADDEMIGFDGAAEATRAARVEAWPQVIAFLHRAFEMDEAASARD